MKIVLNSIVLILLSLGTVIGQNEKAGIDLSSSDHLNVAIQDVSSVHVGDKSYSVVKFGLPLSTEDHEELIGLGVELLEYRGDWTYLISSPKTLLLSDLQQIGGSYLELEKKRIGIGMEVLFEDLPEYSKDGDMALLLMSYPKDIEHETAEALCLSSGIKVLESNGYNNFMKISVPKDNLEIIKGLPFAMSLEELPPPPVKEDKPGRNLHRVNTLNSNFANQSSYSGEGIGVLVRDDGRIFRHIDFEGRLYQSLAGGSSGDHGDGVAGIMAGAGNLDIDNQGMAFGSDMHVIDYVASFLDETMSLFFDEDAIVTNSSYSNGCNGGYTAIARIVDQQMFDNPTLMHVFSAGNDGFNDCDYGAGATWGNITGGHKQGKNVIAVANLNSFGNLEGTSSRGPARDGRIKPDIAANGIGHVSTDESQGYMVFGGTSAAAPVVAGVTAMLHQAHEELIGNRASAALLKAIMLNTANDSGNHGPDFKFGWGQLNAGKALKAIEERRFIKGTINQGESQEVFLEVPASARGIKVMTYWPDQQSSNTNVFNPALVNDIDTRLVKDGTTFMPFILDPSPNPITLDLPATKGEDHLNNMEQIEVENFLPGVFTLQVDGTTIPFGEAEYYITWEIISDEINVTYPNGGENFELYEQEIVHWDAYGDEGSFNVELIDENNDVVSSFSRGGEFRFTSLPIETEYKDGLRLRISRNGKSDVSDSTFFISAYINNLKVEKVMADLVLTWDTIPEAVSYNIYLLGDKYMEIVNSSDFPNFIIPDEAMYKDSWIAVSANYPGGLIGKRSVAIPSNQAALLEFTNSVDGTPCEDVPFTLEAKEPQSDFTYRWRFGSRAVPTDADGPGPHEVFYTRDGLNSGRYFVNDGFTEESVLFRFDVQVPPIINLIVSNEFDPGEFEFSAEVESGNEYFWEFGDGNTSEEMSPTHTYEKSGDYEVSLTLTGLCGEISETKMVNVAQTVSTNEWTSTDFVLGPNPNDGAFSIQLPEINDQLNIKLMNISGQLIEQRTINNTNSSKLIYFEDIPKGQYLINIASKDQQIALKVEVVK